jgi:ankyrin repeat protein
VQLLLQHGATAGNPNAAVVERNEATPGVAPLHLLACWHPGDVANSSSSSANALSSKPGSSKKAATGEEGMSAAEVAGVAEQLASAKLLLEQQQVEGGPDVNVPGGSLQMTPLAFAANIGAYDMTAWLINRGADVNLPRAFEIARPISLAVAGRHTKLACLLLQRGAEVSWPGQFVVAAEAASARVGAC